MGKDLKGCDLGVGIYQRQDGLYSARYTNKLGKRKEKKRLLLMQKEKLKGLRLNKDFADCVFLCRKGEPTKNSAYDITLFKLADKAGIPRFSMHVLRHTYATRCIEAGMRPKTLQLLLGHSNIGITMNLYVHVTDDEKKKEVERIERMLNVG